MNYDNWKTGQYDNNSPMNQQCDGSISQDKARGGDWIVANIGGVEYFGQIEEVCDENYVFWDELNDIERHCTEAQIISVNTKRVQETTTEFIKRVQQDSLKKSEAEALKSKSKTAA